MDAKKRKQILDAVAKLRVTDIRDGMGWVGLHARGSASPEIRPLWRTKAAGFARTCRHNDAPVKSVFDVPPHPYAMAPESLAKRLPNDDAGGRRQRYSRFLYGSSRDASCLT